MFLWPSSSLKYRWYIWQQGDDRQSIKPHRYPTCCLFWVFKPADCPSRSSRASVLGRFSMRLLNFTAAAESFLVERLRAETHWGWALNALHNWVEKIDVKAVLLSKMSCAKWLSVNASSTWELSLTTLTAQMQSLERIAIFGLHIHTEWKWEVPWEQC